MSWESEPIMTELYHHVLKETKLAIQSNKDNMEVIKAFKSFGRKILKRMRDDIPETPAWVSDFQEEFKE